jgi:SAM-dependent methyltransferase
MLERLVEWQILSHVFYTAIDQQPDNIALAKDRLPRWAKGQQFSVRQDDSLFIFQRGPEQITLMLEAIDIFDFIHREQQKQQWDLLIAHAFLDIVDPPTLLPQFFTLLKPSGLFYFTINFDGETILLPEIDCLLDHEIIARYHQTMDVQHPASGSRSGRLLVNHLQSVGATIIDVGSSDWVVFADRDGYKQDEAYFLHCIIDTIGDALHDKISFNIQPWLKQRHAQIEADKLIYIAHQLDFVGSVM